jgi:class 3 adenylate cyclase
VEPQVRYLTGRDGVRIAYYAIGSGPATVTLILPGTHLLAEWRVPEIRMMWEAIAGVNTLVRIDPRGFGLSERNLQDFDLDTMASDVDAVVERLGLDRVRVYGDDIASLLAVAYAARRPDRVSHLILCPGVSKKSQLYHPRLAALLQLAHTDWVLASETLQRSFFNADDNRARELAAVLRSATTPEELERFAAVEWAVEALLPTLAMPTLVIHPRNDPNRDAETSRRTAAMIPDCRFVEVDNQFEAPQVTGRFLASTTARTTTATARPRGTAIILFADVVASTALTEQMGDAAFREKTRELEGALERIVQGAGGTRVEGRLLGDGILAVFRSAREAIDAALKCGEEGQRRGLPLHLGLHAGDVIREHGDIFGGAVNIAARIAGKAAPGELLVSQTVRDLARTSAGVEFDDRGSPALKGVGEAPRLYAVRPRG